MWFKIILLNFYPQTQRSPAKLLMQFFCSSLLTIFFLLQFYSDIPANSQWAIKDYSQSNKLYLLTKKQITKACKCFITAYHANIVQITAIDSNGKTLGEAEPESRRRRYEQEEVIKTGNPWWHKVLILACAWICGFHLAIFSSVWLFLRLWDTAGIRCSRLCPDITFLIYVLAYRDRLKVFINLWALQMKFSITLCLNHLWPLLAYAETHSLSSAHTTWRRFYKSHFMLILWQCILMG